ncbi:ribosomal protein S18-alanine N-acetyltransferase [Paradesulfitobacterium aromaticivorans]
MISSNHTQDRSAYPYSQAIVRPMTGADLDKVMHIEHSSFTTPWSQQAFVAELRDNEYARYFCLELEGRIIGYMGLWIILDEGHITNVAIEPQYRSQGWGKHLMRSVIRNVLAEGVERMTLEVRVSNLEARRLYDLLGFKEAGVRKGYYSDTREDALIMWLELS